MTPDPSTREEMVNWLHLWAGRLDCVFNEEESIEIGPDERVRVMGIRWADSLWVYYRWHDEDARTHEPNGLMWVPDGVYLQHDVVAIVVQRGGEDDALRQMYEWGRWFDARGFDVQLSGEQAQITRPSTPEPEDGFARMRWLLETGGTDGLPEVIELLIDEAESAATVRAEQAAKLLHLSSAIDMMEVGP